MQFEGKLYASKSGYLLLQVPNALGIGAYRALNQTGIVLPSFEGDKYNAHITVMRPPEVASVGGFENINERGKSFAYSVVGTDSVAASSQDSNYSRYWFLRVRSPELSQLRRTYGLPSEPDVPFHISFAARPRLILRENGISKLSELLTKEKRHADGWKQQAWADSQLVDPGG